MREQVAELRRQARIKVLAAEADARWEAKPSLLDMPTKEEKEFGGGRGQTTALGDGQVRAQELGRDRETREAPQEARSEDEGEGRLPEQTIPQTGTPSPDPWKRAERGAPGETWQPEAWTPTPARKR